jgi:predicted RNase H-like nuclease
MATDSATAVVGADACPAGWLATTLNDGTVTVDTYGQFEQVRDSHTDADRILVDIPIGLPSDGRRRCDTLAKDLLGCRGMSVFYTPSESAIQYEDYEDAKEEHEEDIAHGLIMQAHNLRDKIREVRAVVGDDYDGLVRESHPELCFAALNGQPIAYAKSSYGRAKLFLIRRDPGTRDTLPLGGILCARPYQRQAESYACGFPKTNSTTPRPCATTWKQSTCERMSGGTTSWI